MAEGTFQIPDEEALDEFRHVGDPLADGVVAEMVRRRMRPTDPVDALRQLAREDVPVAVDLWNHVNETPRWVDFAAMKPAFEVALQNVIPSGLSLMAGSLVESYASANGAKVLVKTGRLTGDTRRRLFETAKYASDLALDRGARPGNRAWRNVVAVRLMHAWVRHSVRDRPDWDHEAWGLPVNQEDYAGTLFMFSLVYRRSLIRMGVPLTEEEQRGNHLNWRHVGWLMGVHPDLLTTTIEEEAELYRRVKERQFAPDDDSRTLAHGLLTAMANTPPFFLPAGALFQLSRRLVGDRLADALGFPRSGMWAKLLDGGEGMTRVIGSLSRRIAPVSVPLGARLTRGIVDYGLPDGTRFA